MRYRLFSSVVSFSAAGHRAARLTAVWLAALIATITIPAHAEPFSWEEAVVERGVLDLEDGGVEYRAGAILLGDRFDVAVELAWPEPEQVNRQQVVREMADSPPDVSVRRGDVCVTLSYMPTGALETTEVETCFRKSEHGERFDVAGPKEAQSCK